LATLALAVLALRALPATSGTPIASGALTVTLGPRIAVARGARWRVDDRAPLASGATATELSPGLHRVTFTRVTPFRPPVTVKIAVDEARTTSLRVNYLEADGRARVPRLVGLTRDEATQSLLASALTAGTVTARAQPHDPAVAVIGQSRLAGTLLERQTAVDFDISFPLDADRFLTLVNTPTPQFPGVSDDDAARAYYDAVDPLGERTTLADWLRTNGVDGAGGESAEAIYFNDRDLGFGRHMHMWRTSERTIYWVDNYRTVDDAIAGRGLLATVAMEMSPIRCDGAQADCVGGGGDPLIKFFTFDGAGNRIVKIDLDGRGEKVQPAMCLTCHGGNPKRLVDLTPDRVVYPDFGDTEARFIPFDLDSFAYSTTDARYARSAQEAAFERLNAGVRDSYARVGRRVFEYTGTWPTIVDPVNNRGVPLPSVTTVQVAGLRGAIADLELSFDGAYPCSPSHRDAGNGLGARRLGDLVVKLISPSGTSVKLVDHLPKQLASQIGRVQTMCHARLDDQASTPLREASAPAGYVRGVYRPDAPLAAFDGEDPNGIWTLSVTDTIADDPKIIGSDPVGSVRDWSIAIATDEGDEPATELIRGWYDATGRFDGSWVPPGWRPPAAPETASALYLDTVRLNCRTCHLQQTDRLDALDFSSWEKFASFRERIRYLVFDAGVMPVARRTYQVFWLAEHPSASAALAAFAGATRGPGRPVASAGSDRSVEIGTAVRLDAGESLFASEYEWRFEARPRGSEAVLEDAASATPTFTPDVPGAFRVSLVVGDGASRSESATVTITATVSSARKSFTKDVVPLLVDCRSCHARETAPGRFQLDDRETRYFEMVIEPSTFAPPTPRVNPLDPLQSLVLLKPSRSVSHGGGRRRGFDLDGDHSRYDIIRQWIEQSAPDVPVND
jgi:hypothetical protein